MPLLPPVPVHITWVEGLGRGANKVQRNRVIVRKHCKVLDPRGQLGVSLLPVDRFCLPRQSKHSETAAETSRDYLGTRKTAFQGSSSQWSKETRAAGRGRHCTDNSHGVMAAMCRCLTLTARQRWLDDITGNYFLSRSLTIGHDEPGADPPGQTGMRVAWQIRNRDLNAPSAPVRAQATLNGDPPAGWQGPSSAGHAPRPTPSVTVNVVP